MIFGHNIVICPYGHSRQSLPGWKPIFSYEDKCLAQGQHLVLVGIAHATSGLPLSGLIQQTTNSLFFFITKKSGFDISCNGDNLLEMQILISWKNEKNISKCHLLKILPRVLSVMVCTNKLRMSLCMTKPTIKLVRRDRSACTSVV